MKIVRNEGVDAVRSRENRVRDRASDWTATAKVIYQANQPSKAMQRGVALEGAARKLWEIQ